MVVAFVKLLNQLRPTTNPLCFRVAVPVFDYCFFSGGAVSPGPGPCTGICTGICISVCAGLCPASVWFTAAVPVCALAAPALSRSWLPDAAPQPDKAAIEADTETTMANAIKDFTLLLILHFLLIIPLYVLS